MAPLPGDGVAMSSPASSSHVPEYDAPPEPPGWGTVLSLQMTLSALAGFIATVVWASVGFGYFWPMWVWFGVGAPLALHGAVYLACRVPPGRVRGLAVHGAVAWVLSATLVAVWAMSGGGHFWPLIPALGLAASVAVHAMILRAWPGTGERALADRVVELTRTRRGALDVQAAELRRIERDLHDGAQARLVALSMRLGRAEDRLTDRPELAALLREARADASAAIAELRDLARGIAPPVLADRGLAAAVEALGRRSAIPVTVDAELRERLPPIVETVAYFVVAESLTNAAKHAGSPALVRLTRSRGRLMAAVSDDGPGGADPAGGGLTGLRHRVEAIDGTLAVHSPPGQGTMIRAELPCE
jgi:signal transduction histidine kinase